MQVIFELKNVSPQKAADHEGQLQEYMRMIKCSTGVLLNFPKKASGLFHVWAKLYEHMPSKLSWDATTFKSQQLKPNFVR